ncbi:hypothetical protein LCGC14_2005580 [marine sediment metagenome]|uniref:Membrane iron-sulfur containing protein FtrD-like domain-containing protein n=1 Tax=marine sediment metagenome TaxID=412755 RepID=A0A0F9FPJ0_9ZZZZ
MPPVIPIAFREALECSLILLVLASHPRVRQGMGSLLSGALLGILAGAAMSYLPATISFLHDDTLWSTFRHIAETSLFILPAVLLFIEGKNFAPPTKKDMGFSLFVLGLVITVFDARLTGFYFHEIALIQDSPAATPALALLGAGLAFTALLAIGPLKRLRPERLFTPAALVLAAATLRILTGGIEATEEVHTIEALRLGLQGFFSGVSSQIRDALMLAPHEFIETGGGRVFDFLSGQRMSTTVLVLLLTAPPVMVLMSAVSRPDPDVSGIEKAAERRLTLSLFRTDIILKGAPPLICFFLVLGALHFVTASLNPLNEARPVFIEEDKEDEARAGVLIIPVSGPYGELSDGILRKFSYRYGNRVIRFMALMKPNGTLGVGLDECAVCSPPQWNEKASGYAQRGDHLVCKYCMTPIPANSVNKPGGCNPIPLPFVLVDERLEIETAELIRVWRGAQKLEKKGTHL